MLNKFRLSIKLPLKKLIALKFRNNVENFVNKEALYKYEDIDLKIFKGVFHPHYFLSTKIFLAFIKQLSVSNKKCLELGAGSGLISFYLKKQDAIVSSSDINDNAIEGLYYNSKTNQLDIQVLKSDLFDDINGTFDFIFINPPYYPKTVMKEWQTAWYCGEKFEYFIKLFSQLRKHITNESKVYMILSEDCNIIQISLIAQENNFRLLKQIEKIRMLEKNYIFELIPTK